MRITLVGINHKTAPVEVRERLHFSPDQAEIFLRHCGTTMPVEESLLLSTCNRTELLVRRTTGKLVDHKDLASLLIDKLLLWKNIETINREFFYSLHDHDAVMHWLRVAAGLDSMIIGESQILGQMKDAYHIAFKVESSGQFINKIMHAAFRSGKRARAETNIGIGAVSVSLAAVERLQTDIDELSGKRVLLIGAGETARLTAEHLASKGVGTMDIINRTFEKAEHLAKCVGASALPWSELGGALCKADAILSAVSAEEYVLSGKTLASAVKEHPRRRLICIDMGVPRSIDPEAAGVEGILVRDIDDLNQIVDANIKERKTEIPKVEAILREEFDGFQEWRRSLDITPTIGALVKKYEHVRRKEVESCAGEFSPEQLKTVDELTKRLVKKILRHPIEHLRSSQNGAPTAASTCLEAVRKVFDLGERCRDE
jgi:glutamyl-tRNA reductase